MSTNEQTIRRFYEAFQKKDYKTMQDCYADGATFSDPVFKNLNALEVKKMWEMFCVRSKDLELQFDQVGADDRVGEARWIANYTFSATGKKITNVIKAKFTFEDGKIVTHRDYFNFYRWAQQAFGFLGLVIGWTPFLKRKVQKTARKTLNRYIQSS